MAFDPALDTTREEYDLAVALGYDWVARVHNGEPVPISEYNLERDPFTIIGNMVLIREIATGTDGHTRLNRRRDRWLRRVKLVPLPALA
jgi:hypothetical protein